MQEDEKTYVMVAGKTCPICRSYGLFFVGDESDEVAKGVKYRCESCLTRFDSEKIAVSNSFVTEDGLDEDRIQDYFGRWWEKDRVEAIGERLEALRAFLFEQKGEANGRCIRCHFQELAGQNGMPQEF